MATLQKEKILVAISDPQVTYLLDRVLKSTGYLVTIAADRSTVLREISSSPPALVIVAERLGEINGIDFATEILNQSAAIPLVLFVSQDTPELLKKALQIGISDYLCLPLKTEDILRSIQNTLRKADQRRQWVLLEAHTASSSLQAKVDELEGVTRLARTITASLDLDAVLAAIVDAAVELTNTEEGSLLLLDDVSGELYMRAGRNFKEEFVRTFRLPIQDSLAGNVLRSGKPVLLDEETPQKIKTSYLVHSLAYVPLEYHGHVFGVLGVDNRVKTTPLKDRDIALLSALAEFAVISIQNAGLYDEITSERNKLDAILTRIEDGVIVIDADQRLVLVNEAAQTAFNLAGQNTAGMFFKDVFTQTELLELAAAAESGASHHAEISVPDGRIFSTMLSSIPSLGVAITFHDISHLKRLDKLKSDFVSTVSHDLRSPLTAILGYVELIERAGGISDAQREYIRRVQSSVHNITNLVDDLLNLGRIEAGFDARKENILLDRLVNYSIDGFKKRAADKNQTLQVELPADLPALFGNPMQLRQMLENLLDNALKYTMPGGQVKLQVLFQQNQFIIQVCDTGIGIPAVDLPYIFDKFYRAQNSGGEVTGTGLGLSIVHSIVEAHNGRIWVDSAIGKGSTFTVVLPQTE